MKTDRYGRELSGSIPYFPLTEEQYQRIKHLSQQHNLSMAAAVREILDRHMWEELPKTGE